MSAKEREQLSAEIQILKELRHPNIVAYFNRTHNATSNDVHLYMEYCGNGDLGRYIKTLKKENRFADEEFVWNIFAQTLSALYRCHYGEDPPSAERISQILNGQAVLKPTTKTGRMVIHRDLKPENIFLGEDNSVKLGDFGLSKILAQSDFASTYVGTPFYMSPEVNANERYSLHSDIWSLGCIMYELCAREVPFNARTHFDLMKKISVGTTAPLPAVYSEDLKKAIKSCLQTDANRRPSTAQLISLPIVKVMRAQNEAVMLGKQMKKQEKECTKKIQQAEERLKNLNGEIEKAKQEADSALRRQWEVRAQLEIDRRVKEEIERLQSVFDTEVQKRVAEQLAAREEQAQQPAAFVQSCTPTKAPTNRSLYLASDEEPLIPQNPGASWSTLGVDSEFPSQTDLSELSDLHIESPLVSKKAPRPSLSNQPQKRTSRTPFTRAKTMMETAALPSPMDVHMADPSPVAMAALNLSPRRTAPRAQPDFGTVANAVAASNVVGKGHNIFATAAEKRNWEPTNISTLPSLNDVEDSDADDADNEGDTSNIDQIPLLPSPTRPAASSDPFKTQPVKRPASRPSLGAAGRQKTMPNQLHRVNGQQRLASAPSLFGATAQTQRDAANSSAQVKTRPTSAVPVVATSPTRRPATSAGGSGSPTRSPSRKSIVPSSLSSSKENSSSGDTGVRSKKDNQDLMRTATRNAIQGRTLVELQQARAGGRSDTAVPQLDLEKRPRMGVREVALWDPERDEMPSPFLRKGRAAIVR